MEMKSMAFRAGGPIPNRHTCEGQNISPQFSWTGVPPGTKSMALILHDPDAPRQDGFTHWVLFNIDPTCHEIDEDAANAGDMAGPGIQGKNDGGKIGYMGPCPPSGRHRYIARLYALDTILTLNSGALRQDVESAMEGHILGKAALMGTYAKQAAA